MLILIKINVLSYSNKVEGICETDTTCNRNGNSKCKYRYRDKS